MSNHLADERSRYLSQHAENPVDWHPWSPEPFRKAAEEGKPVLVSIGYSSCHWCHVMAHESFEDIEVAGLINEKFVAIKVDKEENPDVDGFYMEFLTRLTGQGGWPLNVFVNPNRAPFYATTYLPKGQLSDLLRYIREEYDKKEEIQTQTIDGIFAVSHIGSEQIKERLSHLETKLPPRTGGAQFPQGAYLAFLLQRGGRESVVAELDNLVFRGLFDHAEGGWFRYSVDPDFRIPHFEKMLYDQASLLYLCASAYVHAPELCRYAIERCVSWLEGHMKLPSGLYGSATDADTADGEGYYYTEEGFDGDDEHHLFRAELCGRHEGRYLPWLDFDFFREHRGPSEEAMRRLREKRADRTPPALDPKAIISWNCFLGYALVKCAAALESVPIAQMAVDLHAGVTRFVSTTIPHVVYEESVHEGSQFLEDYAGYLLFSSSMETQNTRQNCERIISAIKTLFFKQDYLFHTTDPVFENLSLWQDTPTPSGGAMLLTALLDLGREDLEGLDTLGIAEIATQNPGFFALWCTAMDRAYKRREEKGK